MQGMIAAQGCKLSGQKPFGEKPKFSGFDGNSEAEHLNAALLLVERLGRFANLRKRDLNSHMPMSLDGHRRMLKVYEPMRPSLGGGHLLSADQLVVLLNDGGHPNSRQQG